MLTVQQLALIVLCSSCLCTAIPLHQMGVVRGEAVSSFTHPRNERGKSPGDPVRPTLSADFRDGGLVPPGRDQEAGDQPVGALRERTTEAGQIRPGNEG